MKLTIILVLFILLMGLVSGSFFWPLFALGGGAASALAMWIMDNTESKCGVEDSVLVFGMIGGFVVFVVCAVVSAYTAVVAMIG